MSVRSHLKHRLNPVTVVKEVYNHLCHKILPQGCDELANVLFSGSAYLPWPGSNGPKPLAEPPPEEPPPGSDKFHKEELPPEPDNFDKHAALYGVSYTEHQSNDMER